MNSTDQGPLRRFERWPNLTAMFFDQVDRLGERPFLWAKRDGTWRPLSWGDTAARVSALARGLIAAGIAPGDRVVLVSENRPAWTIADLAINAIGAITVPAYITNTVDGHAHVLKDSGAKGAIVSQRRLAERVLAAAESCPDLGFVAAMDPPPEARSGRVRLLHLDQLIETGRARHENIVEKAWSWPRSHTACIIYTSGTGGVPKGVTLSHGAILHNCRGATAALLDLGLDDNVFLSFLPLSHSYEQMAGLYFPIAIGAEIYYAEGMDALAANMLETRPTIMTAVPRLYEVMHGRIRRGGEPRECRHQQQAAGCRHRRLQEGAARNRRRRRVHPDSSSRAARAIATTSLIDRFSPLRKIVVRFIGEHWDRGSRPAALGERRLASGRRG